MGVWSKLVKYTNLRHCQDGDKAHHGFFILQDGAVITRPIAILDGYFRMHSASAMHNKQQHPRLQ